MARTSDITIAATRLYFLPVTTRVPLKFGPETLTQVTCARVAMTVCDARGRTVQGWGETPLSVQWVWPSSATYETRHLALRSFCLLLARAWANFTAPGHALEIGWDFQQQILPKLIRQFNDQRETEPLPYLAALVCCSAFDIALHDAYGRLNDKPTYETYTPGFLTRDLSAFLEPADDANVSFQGRFPVDYLVTQPPTRLPAWHLVGGLDVLDDRQRNGQEPDDGYPVTLRQWIERDGLKCLKIKLRGDDARWDYERLISVGRIAVETGVEWLSTDFNCTVTDPAYVNDILDRLRDESERVYGMILYVEQPFPYDLEAHQIDVHSVSARKPLFMDESAHDWRLVRLGRKLGWTGVALQTCKTQTGAILSLCWAKAHGMTLMVQDLTNPMLAQIPHVLLAAHAGTIMGVETNAMQFYPQASALEQRVHAGLYQRRGGTVDWSTVGGPGFGYREAEIARPLPEPAAEYASAGEGAACP